jgi:hypothetical protein
MSPSNAPVPAERPRETSVGGRIALSIPGRFAIWRDRLGTRGLIMLAVAVVAAGGALNWSWLVAIGLAPIILAVLPCAAMCALGLCMMPKGRESCAGSDRTSRNAASEPQRPVD